MLFPGSLMRARFPGLLLASLLLCAMAPVHGQGTWTPTKAAPGALELPMLLTDGSVIIHTYDGNDFAVWYKLTPDAFGNYANGTWKTIAPNSFGRLYGPSAILRDGRVFYGGGEYLTGNSNGNHNSAEVYDPIANTWTLTPDSPDLSLGDTGAAILPDGRVLCSNWSNRNTAIYDPITNKWSAGGVMADFSGNEETWITLPDGSVLNAFRVGQRYIPSLNQWIPTAPLPNVLVDSAFEIGSAALLFDGRTLFLGGTGHTAFYTMPTVLTDPGTWTAGPDMPNSFGAQDTPLAVEVNGKVLCIGQPLGSTGTEFGPATFLEFDPATNAFSLVPPPYEGFNTVAYAVRFVNLPSGQILMTAGENVGYIYTPVGGPKAAWAPKITSIKPNTDGSFTITGTQLNGLTNGSSYGDEGNPFSHFPIVMLTDKAKHVYFARTYNFSQMQPSYPGGVQNARFKLPQGIPDGAYRLTVNASGISSEPVDFVAGADFPRVKDFSPTSGTVGTRVTITGFGFTGATKVLFGGVSATSFTLVNDTTIQTTVPTNAVTGAITVITPKAQLTSLSPFVVVPALAVRSLALTPNPVAVGAAQTGTVTLTDVAPVGGASVSVSVGGATSLLVGVPAGATSATFPLATKTQGTFRVTATYKGSVVETSQIVTSRTGVVGVQSLAFTPAQVAPLGSTALSVTLTASVTKDTAIPIVMGGAVVGTVTVPTGSSSGTLTLMAPAKGGSYVYSATLNGTTVSITLSVTYSSPVPTFQVLLPSSAPAGSGPITLSARGLNFTNDAQLMFNGTLLKSTIVSYKTLNATLPASLLTTQGIYPVQILQTGGLSEALSFTVTAPKPTLTSLSPATAKAKSGQITVTLTGANFTSDAQVVFNGVTLTTKFVSSTSLKATVPATLLAAKGAFSVTVTQASGISSALTFTVN